MSAAMERLSDVARRLGVPLLGADAGFTRVTSDTRQLARGDLFVALSGERFDGNEFVRRAASLGAAGALVSRRCEDCELPQIVVPDTLRALQDYARSWRVGFELPVVAVTGSNGKTTTKQLLAAIFAQRGPVLATEGNLNNHIGVPLTLTRLRAEHRTAVIEMGANHAGEIAQLAAIAQPDVGVITQAGDAHLEGFGSREGVARAKGELFAALREGGVAAINADDDYADLWRGLARHAGVLRFGFTAQADVRAVAAQPVEQGMRFDLVVPDGRAGVLLPLPGRHNVSNALAAATCAVALGLSAEEIAAGLARVQAPSGRVAWKRTRSGARLIDDSYNANPTSLQAGLQLLAEQRGQRWAVLGGMAELGPEAPALHERCGRAARELGIDRLYAVGTMGPHYARGFGPGARFYGEIGELVAALEQDLGENVVLLIKGSRSARMERVVQALAESAAQGEAH